MYLYRAHIGDGYFSEKKLNDNELICSICGGRDELVCEFSIDDIDDAINKAELRYSTVLADEYNCLTSRILANNRGIAYVYNNNNNEAH